MRIINHFALASLTLAIVSYSDLRPNNMKQDIMRSIASVENLEVTRKNHKQTLDELDTDFKSIIEVKKESEAIAKKKEATSSELSKAIRSLQIPHLKLKNKMKSVNVFFNDENNSIHSPNSLKRFAKFTNEYKKSKIDAQILELKKKKIAALKKEKAKRNADISRFEQQICDIKDTIGNMQKSIQKMMASQQSILNIFKTANHSSDYIDALVNRILKRTTYKASESRTIASTKKIKDAYDFRYIGMRHLLDQQSSLNTLGRNYRHFTYAPTYNFNNERKVTNNFINYSEGEHAKLIDSAGLERSKNRDELASLIFPFMKDRAFYNRGKIKEDSFTLVK